MNEKIRITITAGCGVRKGGLRISLGARCCLLNRVRKMFLDVCEGYTMKMAEGGWRNDGKDWEEPCVEFSAVVTKGQLTFDGEVLAAFVRDTFEQQCVLLTIEPIQSKLI